ncbi:hypothetical protein [Halovivax gelatinilyticus]|uniref:hypothetical protein n=1 Tax=Halovivax gelatinilyticus TaxID=2961597 RepID=UPI0020CA27F6|nr:hypothetical protein [Halovivax gelatinilyticus]
MSGDDSGARSNVSAGHIGLLVFTIVATIFALLSQTRPVVFAVLWIGAPVVAFGTLVRVFRGNDEIRSARGLLFAMICGVLTVAAIPLGFAIVAETIADAIALFGFITALLAIGIARLSVTEPHADGDRDIPTPEALAEYEPFEPADSDEPHPTGKAERERLPPTDDGH